MLKFIGNAIKMRYKSKNKKNEVLTMKKITAIICSVVMTCAMFASCGEESSSSKAETSSAVSSSESASDETSDSSSVEMTGDSTYAAAYTEKLRDGNFAIELTSASDYMGELEIKMEVSGDNFHMYMGLGEFGTTDTYYLDGKMYVLDEASKTYMVSETETTDTAGDDITSTGFGLSDEYEFVSSEETDDGMVCESYSYVDEMYAVDSETEVEPSIIKYYFDKASGDINKIEVTEMGMTQTVTINSFTVGDVEITLPDLSDWTETDMSSLWGDTDIEFSDESMDSEEAE